MDRLDLKLMPIFDGSPTGLSVVKWFEKAGRVCRMFKVKDQTMVIQLKHSKGTYAPYQQFGDEADLQEIKLGMDSFLA